MQSISDFIHNVSSPSRSQSVQVQSDVHRAFFSRQANQRSLALRSHETWWRSHAATIKKDGYRLRPRFRPNWKPVWLNSDLNPYLFEDAYAHETESVMDANKLEDEQMIAIKRVRRASNEIAFAKIFSSESSRGQLKNHCVPILDHFYDRIDPMWDYLVMPLLRKFDSPEFFAASEVVEFVRQTLEGLDFMHSMGVAHRNLTNHHIMMEGNALFPDGFHPSRQDRSPDCKSKAVSIRRINAHPVRYFFVDFSHAVLFESGNCSTTGRKEGLDGATEQSTGESCDPFPVDVYTLGQVYRSAFIDACTISWIPCLLVLTTGPFFFQKYTNVDFLLPLVDEMTKDVASARPSAVSAAQIFQDIICSFPSPSDWRLSRPNEPTFSRIYEDLSFSLSCGNSTIGSCKKDCKE